MITSIKLPSDRFENSQISNLKKKVFIFGNNGTGKSTITTRIKEQYQNDYDVRIFQGFKSVIDENEKLNTIALGQENAELQPIIVSKENEIISIKQDITPPANSVVNSYTLFEKAKKDYNKKEQGINQFCTMSASDIRKSVAINQGDTYDIRNFKKDIPLAKNISEQEILTHEKTLKESKLPIGKIPTFPTFDTSLFLTLVNEILQTEVTKNAVLNFSSAEENWVRSGLSLHEHSNTCVFCQNIISQKRLTDLNSYFSLEIKNLEERIKSGISKIKTIHTELLNLQLPHKETYYFKFQSSFVKIQNEYLAIKNRQLSFLNELNSALEEKASDLFKTMAPIKLTIPKSFEKLQNEMMILHKDNVEFGNNLSVQQDNARNALRLNKVDFKLKEFNYENELEHLQLFEKEQDISENKLKLQKNKLLEKQKELQHLLEQTKDEEKSANEINKYLEGLGNQSFKIVKVEMENGQKGQYQISDMDDNIREVHELSTGEKNIVAFLWFLYDLNNTEKAVNKEKVLVFDDPMNSNDNTTQYLIISKIQELFKNGDSYANMFVLTHNIHFYLNVRHMNNWWKRNGQPESNKLTVHLNKINTKSRVGLLTHKDEDFDTSYATLWQELKFLYENNKVNLMLNPCRRILETYQKFNSIDTPEIYGSDIESQKLFNVNSHSIDDVQADLNGKTRDEVINKLKNIFNELKSSKHFETYWDISNN